MKIATLAAAILVAAGGCARGPVDTTPGPTHAEAVAGIVGSWEWVSSTGGIAGWQLSPQTEGYEVRLVFGTNGRVSAFRNDSLVGETGYQVHESLKLMAPGAPREFLIRYDEALRAFVFAALDEHGYRMDDSTALFEEPCCDRYTHTFRRGG